MADQTPMCRAHERAAFKLGVFTMALTVLLLLGLAAIPAGALLMLAGQPTATLAVAIPALIVVTVDALYVWPQVRRRARWLAHGLKHCGSCRAVREGRRTPDGAPITPKASPR